MKPEIIWINHAGYELRVGGLRIVHDPWLFGMAFGEGWALVSESRFDVSDFEGVDYIWFSHEHPDHFSPAVLKKIPEQVRAKITILFQETKDRRVVDFCARLGFPIRELRNGEKTQLNDDVAVTCGTVGRDSWLFTETADCAIFNANDCVGIDWNAVASRIARPVDLLLTQFSYANWVGNPDDTERMAQAAADKLREMDAQLAAFEPDHLIPFASYVWFCRTENFHMNAQANRIGAVHDRFKDKVDTIILYPGDHYRVGEPHDNASAIARYDADWRRHDAPIDLADKVVPLDEIIALGEAEQRRLRDKNMLWLLRPLAWARKIRPVSIYLEDLGTGVRYSMFGGVVASGVERSACDLACSSASFAAMLRSGFGYSTTWINGRFRELAPGASLALSRHFAIAARNEEGDYLPGLLLRRDYVSMQLRRLASRSF